MIFFFFFYISGLSFVTKISLLSYFFFYFFNLFMLLFVTHFELEIKTNKYTHTNINNANNYSIKSNKTHCSFLKPFKSHYIIPTIIYVSPIYCIFISLQSFNNREKKMVQIKIKIILITQIC